VYFWQSLDYPSRDAQSSTRIFRRGVKPNLYSLSTVYEVARYIGEHIRIMQESDRSWLEKDGIDFQCNFLLGGQIRGTAPELFLIYSQGNCIQASPETPFLQIGETKYGKPILDRTLSFDSSLDSVAKCALLIH
jgi:putative proteasome-type protease